MEQLATKLLIEEIDRRLDIIQREENPQLLDYMINTLTVDLCKFLEVEKLNIVNAFDKGYETDFSDDDENYSKGTEYYYENYGKQNYTRGLSIPYDGNTE